MARPITAGQRTQLASRRAAHFLRVEVQDAGGVWRDVRSIGGADYQLGAAVSSSLDTPATTATVTLRAGRSFASIAPGMTGATANASGRLLDVGRGVRIDVAVLAPGATPAAGDWVRLFDGRIDTVDQDGGGRLTLRARDRMVPILDAMFLQNESLGDGSSSVEFVLQGMLIAALGPGAPTLVTPVSPAWAPPAGAVRPRRGEQLWARMSALVDQIGWLVRFRWSGNAPELRLFAPVRQPTAGDVAFTIAGSEVRSVESAAFDLAPVRNLVQVLYRAEGSALTVSAQDLTSQATYGVRRLIVSEDSASQIRTAPQAQRMADAILADLRIPPVAYRLSHLHCFWPVEVGDVIDVAPDGVAFDATQRLGVVSVEHQLDEGGGRTVIGLRGTPASRGRSWLTVGGASDPAPTDPTSASASFTSTGAVRVNVIGPTDATAVRAAVSTSGPPSEADVDAATGSMSAAASMAALTSAAAYGVGTTVYVAAAAYVGGVRGRVVQLVIVRDAAAGTVALGPDLEVRLALDATQGTVTYVADGTVEISEDGSAFAAAPASPFTRPRAAQGSDTVRTITLRASLNGQAISNTVVIPARATVDTDTVAPDLRLIRATAGFGDPASFVAFSVQGTNPKAGGPAPSLVGTWAGTTVERFDGAGWIAMTSGAALVSGDLLRMARPANGATPGTFTARATIAAGGAEEITVPIPQGAIALPPAVVARIVSSTPTTATVQVTTDPGGGTVALLGTTATTVSGPAVGVASPNGQTWTFARQDVGGGPREATFRGAVAGAFDDDAVTIPEQGRDTVPVLVRAQVIDTTPDRYVIRVSASAAGGPREGVLTLTQADGAVVLFDNDPKGAGFALGIGVNATDGDLTNPVGFSLASHVFEVLRPPPGGEPARVAFRVAAPGCAPDADPVSILPQNPLAPAVVCRVTASDATTHTVTVTTEPPGGTVQLRSWSGAVSGPPANTDQPSGTAWTFTRPPFQFGDDEATFAGTVAGVTDTDAITVPEQGRDTIAILTRVRVLAIGATSYTVRVSASAPFGPRTGTLLVTQAQGVTINGGAVLEGASGALEVATTDGDYGAAGRFNDYIVSRPPVGAQPGRVSFRVSAPGCTEDSDSVDIEPQRALGDWRVLPVGVVTAGASVTVRYRLFRPDGVQVTGARSQATSDVFFYEAQPGGGESLATPGVAWDAANSWYTGTVTRTAGRSVRAVIVEAENASIGARRTDVSVPLPTFNEPATGSTAAFSSIVCTANTTLNRIELSYLLAAGLEGATIVTSLEIVDGGDGLPVVPGVTGSRGAVAFPWTPDAFTIVPFTPGATKLYRAQVALQAYIAGALVGSAFTGCLFYVNNTGT